MTAVDGSTVSFAPFQYFYIYQPFHVILASIRQHIQEKIFQFWLSHIVFAKEFKTRGKFALNRMISLQRFCLVVFSIGIKAYLPGIGVNRDQQGGSPRARLDHCTPIELTSAISPNVGNSDA